MIIMTRIFENLKCCLHALEEEDIKEGKLGVTLSVEGLDIQKNHDP